MSTRSGSVTDRVRQQLAIVVVADEAVEVELGALLRAAGTLVRRGRGWRVELETSTGASARRAHALLRRLDVHPTIRVREATNLSRRTYGVVVEEDQAPSVGASLGLLDADGMPTAMAPSFHERLPKALLRGALLGAGSVAPSRPPHLELAASRRETAEQLARAVASIVGITPSVGETRSGYRATLKSGEAIADLLGALGATSTLLDMEEQQLRRQLRGDAQRLANADAANVRRAVDAAGEQTALVERAIKVVGWDAMPDELRAVALARLANPAASLSELGELCDPPIGKSAVHRRLGRLREMAERAAG